LVPQCRCSAWLRRMHKQKRRFVDNDVFVGLINDSEME
jgi:hypothetical protein